MLVTIKLFSAGYCIQSKMMAIKGAKNELMKFHTIFALIKHTKAGYFLFDTGYSSRFFEETKLFPFNIYSQITPVHFKEEEGAVAQLEHMGIHPAEIKHVILSHFHPDHIGSMKDFVEAEFLCLRSAYEDIKKKKGVGALMKAFLPGLLPYNFEEKIRFIDDARVTHLNPEYAPFTTGYDLLGDGSMIAIELPGHAQGQSGLIVSARNGTYFLVADACWLSESYRRNLLPHPVAGLIFSSRRDYRMTLEKIHQLHKKNSDIKIIPSHCSEVWEQMVQKGGSE